MADRFNRIDNTAPITDVAEGLNPDVKYSNFDLSRKIVGQAIPYAIIPIDVIETVPKTTVNLNYDVQITFRNPAVRKLLNGFRVYLHTYYNKKSDLWEGWNNFVTRGRSGTMNLKIPHIATRLKDTQTNKTYSPFTPMSLYNYLGIPSEYIAKDNNGNKILTKKCGIIPAKVSTGDTDTGSETGLGHYENIEISALDAMMYQRLWRDKYSPQNLLLKNKNIFPDNEDHFILSYEADEVNRIKYGEEKASGFWNITNSVYYIQEENDISMRLDCLRFRQYQGDRFTTASPFQDMLRGESPELKLNINDTDLVANIAAKDVIITGEIEEEPAIPTGQGYTRASHADASSGNTYFYADESGKYIIPKFTQDLGYTNLKLSVPGQIATVSGEAITSAIKLSDLRSLEVFTIFAERMARCSGSYNSMIKQQFGHNPKSENREAIYIGGSYQDILLNSIYSTTETEKQALGTQIAQGQSASYNKIGSFTADDYGLVMTVMTIVPETIYTTGISKLKTALTMEEQYYPIMNNLSAEPILNQELYVSGTKETDETPYGYAERFSEYKSRRNKACGLSELANTDDEFDSALVMARRFNTTQNLNANFVTGHPDNVSLDSFTSNDEAPFDFAIRQDINVTYPMPYVTIPQGLGTRA